MKTKWMIITVANLILVSTQIVFAGGNACTPPSGDITISPNQTDSSGNQLIGIDTTATLTSTNLADKDCWCASPVADSIDTYTGVQWVVDGATDNGTLSGGGTGTPTTWTVSANTGSPTIHLKLKNKATAPNTTNDGPMAEAKTKTIQVVIPDHDDWSNTAGSCDTGSHGKERWFTDTVSKSGASVSFQGAYIWEKTGTVGTPTDGCLIFTGGISTGTPAVVLDAYSTAANMPDGFGDDAQGVCASGTNTIPGPANCVSWDRTQWDIGKSGGTSGTDIYNRKYLFTNTDGTLDNIALSATIASYP